jgi:hypothetical protein
MLRRILSKIKGFCRPKEDAEAILYLKDLVMREKAMELDEKRKQDYIQ